MTRRYSAITIHGVGLPRVKTLLHHSDMIICQRKSVLQKLLSLGFKKDNVVLVEASAVDTEKFRFGGTKSSARVSTVTFVGRLVPFKGPELLLEAVPLICSSHENIVFQFVGEGPLSNYLIEKTKKLKLDNHVQFLGARNDVDSILRASDVYVALSPYENFSSLTLFEAMSCGLSIVATDVGETKTLNRDKETMLLAKPHPRDIAEKVAMLLADQDLRRRLGKNARELMLKRYSLEALAQIHERLYFRIVQSGR